MDQELVDMLQCPACTGTLRWEVRDAGGRHMLEADARCSDCGAVYPIREGIGAFLTPDLARNDLWEQAESGLSHHLRHHPEDERELLQGDPEALNGPDLLFRAMVLEERGEFEQAGAIAERARLLLYGPQYLRCLESEIEWVVERLNSVDGPIVDLASGRGTLVDVLLDRLDNPIVASDFSPTVLQRNRRRLISLGLEDRVSLLAFDARRTPFKSRAVQTMTTFLGLPNIEDPGTVLTELRRVVGGSLLAVTHFYPPDDDANAQAIREAGISPLLYGDAALAAFAEARWKVEVRHARAGLARPTGHSRLLGGAGIDTLPVAETVLEWCVLEAR